MELIDIILTFAGIVVGAIISVSPIVIMNRLSNILNEQRRHDRMIEAKVDIIHDILRDISEGPSEEI